MATMEGKSQSSIIEKAQYSISCRYSTGTWYKQLNTSRHLKSNDSNLVPVFKSCHNATYDHVVLVLSNLNGKSSGRGVSGAGAMDAEFSKKFPYTTFCLR